jgi:hypothetical protein
MEEVLDGGALAQELGVGDDVEEAAGDPVALDGAADPLVGVDRNGGLFDDDLVAGERARNLAGDGLDVGEVGVAGLRLRGADGDEDGVAESRWPREVGGEADPGCCGSAREVRAGAFSWMRVSPDCRAATLPSSLSTHTTEWPISAKQTAATRPTYPDPTTAI